ncbi:MAG: radical SAM protein [Promethearchaeota archaeon]
MEYIRVSAGSACILGLKNIKLLQKPTTIHLLQYSESGCKANCAFCPQAKNSWTEKKWLSRISWPKYSWPEVLDGLIKEQRKRTFRRICLQTVLYETFLEDMFFTLEKIRDKIRVPVSVALVPVSRSVLRHLFDLGVDRIGIALDSPTGSLFSRIKGKEAKGPFRWEGHMKTLEDALEIFGKGRVTTHQIIGMGENIKEEIKFIQEMHDLGVQVGLFAFTPIKGTRMEKHVRPSITYFRKVQVARYLIMYGFIKLSDMSFTDDGKDIVFWGLDEDEVIKIIKRSGGKMFETSGCPNCNRPFYTSSPGRSVYNFPSRLNRSEVEIAVKSVFKS